MLNKIKKYLSENTAYLIRLDDIAENMNWDFMDRAESLFDKFNIKPVLGIIPNNKDVELLTYPKKNSDFWEQVRKWKEKGWEIAMHGTNHVYSGYCKKNDYLNVGGNTEFCNLNYNEQLEKIQTGLNKFKKEKINIRTFFAPNHTFNYNTINALQACGVNQIIDGYGIMPYTENNTKFIPQLFYNLIELPFGFQTFQIHLNYLKEKDFIKFSKFIEKNSNKIVDYDKAISMINNNIFYVIMRFGSKRILQIKRLFKYKKT